MGMKIDINVEDLDKIVYKVIKSDLKYLKSDDLWHGEDKEWQADLIKAMEEVLLYYKEGKDLVMERDSASTQHNNLADAQQDNRESGQGFCEPEDCTEHFSVDGENCFKCGAKRD